MARVTVEDCIDKVTNRFELVLLSAHRARAMSAGAELKVERDNDKNPVVALREIADESTIPAELREELVSSMQKRVDTDEPEMEPMALLGVTRQEETDAVADVFGPETYTPEAATPGPGAPVSGDGESGETYQMSEEDLLRALQTQIDSQAK